MFLPAFRSPISGDITVGPTHFDAFAASDIPSIDSVEESVFLECEGFYDGETFLTRDQAKEQLGYWNIEERDQLQT